MSEEKPIPRGSTASKDFVFFRNCSTMKFLVHEKKPLRS